MISRSVVMKQPVASAWAPPRSKPIGSQPPAAARLVGTAKGQQPAICRGEAPPRGAVSLHVSGSSDRSQSCSVSSECGNLSQQRGARGAEPHAFGDATADYSSQTTGDISPGESPQCERRGVVQHLLQFRVVVTCKTTVCRKQGRAAPNGTYKPARTQVLFSRNR